MAANVVTLFLASAFFTYFFLLTLFEQQVLGYSPLSGGLSYLPFGVGIGAGIGISTALMPCLGVKPLLSAGFIGSAAGLLMSSWIHPGASYAAGVLPGMIVLGVSSGLCFPAGVNAALHQVTGQDASLASGVQNATQQAGGALGLACLVTLALRHAAGQIRHGVPALARGAGDRLDEAVALDVLGYTQRLTGDYAAATANLTCAVDLYRGLGSRQGEASALTNLAAVQRATGDYPAAAASAQQALALSRGLGIRIFQALSLDVLGAVQRAKGDYPAAAASHMQALGLHRDLGSRLGQAQALNGLGELATRTSDSHQARQYHTQALAIARDLGIPLEEARALEGIGQACFHDSDRGEAASHLGQALTIYQRIGAARARRVQDTLRHHQLESHEPPSSGRRQPRG